jgi:hypothetical protein
LSELDFKFMGGTKGPVNFCCVMKGCSFACWGDHRSRGLIFRRPRTKSIKAMRLFISVYEVIRVYPSPADALGVAYLCQSRSASCSYEAWDMT